MNLSGGVMGSMSISSSTISRKSADDQFPAGLRVLVVDDDPTCLTILEKMLRTCRYEVIKTNRAEVALSMLRENENAFDVVISDVHMPDMDGFKLLEQVGLSMDLPVIMMSADDSKHVVMKGVTHGACDYLIKPVRIKELKNIWQHVIRKKKKTGLKELEQSGSWGDEGDQQLKLDDAASSPANEGSWKNSKRKGDDDDSEDKDDTATIKKPRVVWSVELHQQFVAAVNQLGIDKAVPKKILELINVPGLTRENVASHLQKYRLYLRRLSGVSQHHGGLNGAFMPLDNGFSAMSSLGGLDLQTLHPNGQLSAQTLAAYTRLPPSIKPGLPMPFVDARSVFSFDNSKLRYGDGQQQQLQQLGNNKQFSLLHGIPTTMEPTQLAGLNQSAETVGNVHMQAGTSNSHQSSSLLVQMGVQQSRGQLLNESAGGRVPQIQSSIGQPRQSIGAGSGLLSRNGMTYSPASEGGPLVDNYPVNQIFELPGSSFPLGSTPGITSMTPKGITHDNSSSDVKAVRGYVGSYDMYTELQPHQSQEWQLQNQNMTLGVSSQHTTSVQSNVNVAPSVMVNQSYIATQRTEQNGNTLAGKPVFSAGLENHHLGMQNFNHYPHSVLVDNAPRVKTERIADAVSSRTNLYSEPYGQDDLMSALF